MSILSSLFGGGGKQKVVFLPAPSQAPTRKDIKKPLPGAAAGGGRASTILADGTAAEPGKLGKRTLISGG
jgi:hypothetical protein